MRVFTSCGIVTFSIGFLLGVRFLYYFFMTDTDQLHVQSLILGAILMLAGFQMILTGIVADLINSSRSIMEDVSFRLRRMELESSPDSGTDGRAAGRSAEQDRRTGDATASRVG